jgi:hypothetical protein
MSLDEARRLLDDANDRDAVVRTLLDYVHGRFAYCALFIVHADRCVGVEARGEGLTGAPLKDHTLSLARPSVLTSTIASGSAEIVAIEDGSVDAEICAILLRPDVREAVAVPLRMGAKVALVLWADDGAHSPSALAVRNLAQFCALCAEAFMRVIASRKRPAGALNADARPRASVAPRPRAPDRAARLDALRNAFRGNESAAERPSLPESSELPPVQAKRSPPPPEPVIDSCERVVQEVHRTGLLTDAALATLVDAGERGLDAVFKHFPGTHRVQRQDSFSKLPPIAEAGPLLRAAAAFRQLALPRLIAMLDHADADRRFCALVCLSDVVHPSVLSSLTSRLVDTDYPTRMAALEVMRHYRRFDEFEAVGRTLRAVLRDEKSPADQRRAAAYALGELRDVESIPVLVVALGEGDAALAASAHRALVVIARQDFGALAPPWLDWWEGAARKHRIEWLIDALLHAEPTIRHEASEELKRLTGQHVGYYFNLPRRDRERAHMRYVEWWRTEGMQRFAPATGSLAPDPPRA